MKSLLEFLRYESLSNALLCAYRNIAPLYLHTFWIVFGACYAVFDFSAVHFMWGNHD